MYCNNDRQLQFNSNLLKVDLLKDLNHLCEIDPGMRNSQKGYKRKINELSNLPKFIGSLHTKNEIMAVKSYKGLLLTLIYFWHLRPINPTQFCNSLSFILNLKLLI